MQSAESETSENIQKEQTGSPSRLSKKETKRDKKKSENYDSAKVQKPKKTSSIIRKFGLGKHIGSSSSLSSRSKSSAQSSSLEIAESESVLTHSSPTDRKTPEGDDGRDELEEHILADSGSLKRRTSLTLDALKDIEADRIKNDPDSIKASSNSKINVESVTYQVSWPKSRDTGVSPTGRTKSLENIQSKSRIMPAYGELILDINTAMSNAGQSGSKPKDHLYKILVIGDLGAGKTSIIKRYVHQFFSQHYRATIGVDFALKVLNWDENTLIRLQLWDIAGQERYGNMTRVYYKEAVGAFIVFDVTRANTFESVVNWKTDLDSKVQLPDGSAIPCVLLANKCDQQKEGLVNSPSKMDEYCKEKGFCGWFETSAKENVNIEEAARSLVEQILLNDVMSNCEKDGDQFNLSKGNSSAEKSESKCSC